ncbi:DNA excision repair protein ERCC-6-like 2 [Alosa sapidissima]|uniref:DNA excision repair protein ERCC-6-like 2 n=1 Tax=Alosa sapidissima TaxID=34773 RepID=UPI001C09B219|nr:DNA excision repair protein ERCC-6-like 2 [Alosa sapidissima]
MSVKLLDERNDDEKQKVGETSGSTANALMGEKPFFHLSQIAFGESVPFALSKYVKIPYTINRYLRDYQREGAKFIFDNYVKPRGCILGDDMGLGKTIQVISFLAAVLHKTGTRADAEKNIPHFLLSQKTAAQNKVKKVFLIIAPLSLLYNWKEELDTWGYFRVAVVHGVEKEDELARVKKGRCEIALTTYETFRLNLDAFNSINWAAVIVDEAHKIKNYKSQITKAMKKMRCKVRIGLTGTILQNNLEELYCVMDWAIPWCLGNFRQFKSKFAEAIEHGQKHSVTKRTLAVGRQAVQALGQRLAGKFLRRTKALISSQLPAKDDRVVYCSLTEFQQAVYIAVLESEDVILLMRSGQSCTCGSKQPRKKCCYKTNSKGVPVRNLYFSYLAILRKVANHVALLQSKEGTSKKQEESINAICEKVFQKFPEFVERCKQESFEAMSDPMYSGKMRVLQKLLRHFLQKKDKVLLFSLSTKLLDVLESYCMAEGLEYHRLDGTTKAKDRMKIVKEFNGSKNVNLCLVSTMAGGLGLNFVGANIVILFDPTWNPANDLQAIDRVYRIGQCRDVTVFRLISLGTVEEVIYLRQVYKQQLQSSVVGKENSRRYFEAVQGTDGQSGELFGLRNLFRLQLDGTCLTQRILEREGRVEAGVMTAKTQAAEERPSAGQTDLGARGSTEQQQTAGRSNGNQAAVDVLDFSSDSEEEGEASTSRAGAPSTAATTDGAQGSAVTGHGCLKESFTELFLQGLHGHAAAKETGTGSGDEGSSGAGTSKSPAEGTVDSQGWSPLNLSDMETEDAGEKQSSESPDAGASKRPARKKLEEEETTRARALETGVVSETDEDDQPVDSSTEESEDLLAPRPSPTFTTLKTSTGRAGQGREASHVGTIDALLGGLNEVSYTHSNQKVVGSSRAENYISKAAVRDVFERQQYSQLPAHVLLESQETQPGPAPISNASHSDRVVEKPKQTSTKPKQTSTVRVPEVPRVSHAVKHTLKTRRYLRNITVIVGETPNSIRRSHFRLMAEFFGAASVEAFADQLLKSTSEQRQRMLREYYSQQNPDLTDIIKQTFPEPPPPAAMKPTAAPSPSSSSSSSTSFTTSAIENKPALKLTHTKHAPKRRVPSASEGTRENSRTKQSRTLYAESPSRSSDETEVPVSGDCKTRARTLQDPQGAPSERPPHRAEPKRSNTETYIERNREDHQVIPRLSRDDPSKNPHPNKSPITEPNRSNAETYTEKNREVPQVPPGPSSDDLSKNPHSSKSFITDLLGDTSILDGLFKSKRKAGNSQHSQRSSTSNPGGPHVEKKAKARTKDLWDLLNEGNEESINQLTDLTQIEKICSASPSPGKSDSQSSESSLWRKNEKFLWKKTS